MKKIIIALLFTALSTTYAYSKVSFIADADETFEGNFVRDSASHDITFRTQQKCAAGNYLITKCPQGYVLTGRCPHDDKYYKECCSKEFAYNKSDCERMGQKAGMISCGGKYRCY